MKKSDHNGFGMFVYWAMVVILVGLVFALILVVSMDKISSSSNTCIQENEICDCICREDRV